MNPVLGLEGRERPQLLDVVVDLGDRLRKLRTIGRLELPCRVRAWGLVPRRSILCEPPSSPPCAPTSGSAQEHLSVTRPRRGRHARWHVEVPPARLVGADTGGSVAFPLGGAEGLRVAATGSPSSLPLISPLGSVTRCDGEPVSAASERAGIRSFTAACRMLWDVLDTFCGFLDGQGWSGRGAADRTCLLS